MRINSYGNNDSATTFQRNFISLPRNFLMSDEPHRRPFSEDYRGQRVKVRPALYYYYHLYLLFIYIYIKSPGRHLQHHSPRKLVLNKIVIHTAETVG